MRENLIFYGIPEQPAPREGEQLQYENCDMLVKYLIQKALEINTENMRFDRSHRLGGPRARKPRSIVVKFHCYSEREEVIKKSLETNVKRSMQGSNQGIGVQTPRIYEYAKQEETCGKTTRIIGNKLNVNNKVTCTLMAECVTKTT